MNIVKFIVRVAIFGAIATLLYVIPFLSFPLPIFPSFLKFHFDEIPIFIAGFAYGPLAAMAITAIRTLIKLPFSSTLCVGELSDLLFTIAFVLPATIIYKYNRNFKGALIGILVGTVAQLIVAILGNIYIMVPFYMYLFEMDEAALLKICPPFITDLKWSYGFAAVLPFNLIKNAAVIIVTLISYKSLRRLIDKAQ